MNPSLEITRHAVLRSAQRGIAFADIDLITLIGTEIEGSYFVRDKDFQGFERELKALADRARRLVGKRVVFSEGRVVTAYHVR